MERIAVKSAILYTLLCRLWTALPKSLFDSYYNPDTVYPGRWSCFMVLQHQWSENGDIRNDGYGQLERGYQRLFQFLIG
jgi:hypothetical protein